MVTPSGEVKLLDFGIAKAASCVRDDQTVTGTLKGKISYLSPEQADGLPVDRRSDIFALGIVLHEALTMQRLFRSGSDLETLRLIREARVKPPSSVASGIPAELDAVVMRMLAREPDRRFATCDAVVGALTPIVRAMHADAAALRHFLRHLGPTARRAVPQRLANPTPAVGLPVSPARQVAPRSGHRWPVIAGSAVATMVVAVLWLTHGAPELATPAAPAESVTSAPVLSPAGPNAMPTHATELPAPALGMIAPSPAPLPEQVRLVVNGTPGAEVLLDDKLIGTVPVDVRLPRHAGQRQLKVQAPGTQRYARTVAADVDVSLKVTLPKLRPEPPRKKKPASMSVIKDPFSTP
jgi:hypothetical protein